MKNSFYNLDLNLEPVILKFVFFFIIIILSIIYNPGVPKG